MASGKANSAITKYNKSVQKKQNASANSKKTNSKGAKNKKNTAVKTASAKKNTQKNSLPEPKSSSHQIIMIVIGLFLAFVLELSNFEVFGTFGSWLKYGQFGLFGIMAYIFPIVLLLLFIVSTFEGRKKRWIAAGIVLYLFICTFAHLVSSMSLNNHNIFSYFTSCAEGYTGGGILGGTIALGLFLLLSKAGAIIITVLIILVCIFLLFEEPIRSLFAYLFSKDEYEEDYIEEDSEDYDEQYYDEPYEVQDSYRRPVQNKSVKSSSQKKSRKHSYEEPVVVAEEPDGTVIKIVRSYKKHGRIHTTELTRTNKRAQPLRDGSIDVIRSGNKARGISRELDMLPHNANGDEIHEITKHSSQKSVSRSKAYSRNLFADTLIIPAEEEEKEPSYKAALSQKKVFEEEEPDTAEYVQQEFEFDPKEAHVTAVKEAAVNRREKETRPVKVRKAVKEEIQAAEPEPTPQVSPERKAVRKDLNKVMPVVERTAPKDGETPYFAPPLDLLAKVKNKNKTSEAELEKIARNLELILEQFGVNVTVTDIQAGPSVTRFELQPELGTRVNKITSLADDLKLNLGVTEIRIEAPIPGRQAVGIEIPNKIRQTVYMRELIEDPALISHSSKIAFAAGKDISGNVIVADIAKMPHLLVAGTTGSGKSVFLNTILMTILYRAKPSEVGLIIIDPKQVEFGVYAGIPHLMKEVVTDPGQAVSTLRWAVNEMTNRYQRMQMSAVRDFKSYNAKFEKGLTNPEEENARKMNQIVIIIDELADLMMVAKKEAEALICRLAQLARAAGIHLIIATQRPSVDVVTGLIKANIPARAALLVSSQIDSRTIIDMQGAEKLLGNGDMLFYPTGYVKPVRVQGAFVSDDEIQSTVDFLIQNNNYNYFSEESKEIEKYMNAQSTDQAGADAATSDGGNKYDECFYEAGKLCIEMGKASSSMLQRRFNLGFNRAARIIDQLEEFGAVGPQMGSKPREILVDSMTFEEMYQNLQDNH